MVKIALPDPKYTRFTAQKEKKWQKLPVFLDFLLQKLIGSKSFCPVKFEWVLSVRALAGKIFSNQCLRSGSGALVMHLN